MEVEKDKEVQIKSAHIAGRYHLLTGILAALITLVPTGMKINEFKAENKVLISENKELSASNTELQKENKTLADKNKQLSSSKTELKKENKKLVSNAELHMEGIRVLLKNVTGEDYTNEDIIVVENGNEIQFITAQNFIWSD